MLIPYNTDAPVYHLPISTVAMIVANTVVYIFTSRLDEFQLEQYVAPWILQHGAGLQPWQWVTSNFIHGGFLHLLGNMFALWGFGLLVEGKIGWWRFLLLFFGIGFLQCALEQTITLGFDQGGSYGASAIVYGLLAVALVWAPKNEMSCFIIVIYRVLTCELTVVTIAELLLGIEIITGLLFSGLSISSQALHVMGAVIGFGIGVVMLKRGWVDCENWDLFSVWSGRNLMTREQLAEEKERSPEYQHQLQERRESALQEIGRIIESGQPGLAYAAHQKMSRKLQGWELPEKDLLQIISAFHQQKLWSQSIPAMLEYLRTHQQRAPQVRLKLAHILVDCEQRPGQAMRVMAKIDESALSAKQTALLHQLQRKAEVMSAQDTLEVIDEDW